MALCNVAIYTSRFANLSYLFIFTTYVNRFSLSFTLSIAHPRIFLCFHFARSRHRVSYIETALLYRINPRCTFVRCYREILYRYFMSIATKSKQVNSYTWCRSVTAVDEILSHQLSAMHVYRWYLYIELRHATESLPARAVIGLSVYILDVKLLVRHKHDMLIIKRTDRRWRQQIAKWCERKVAWRMQLRAVCS